MQATTNTNEAVSFDIEIRKAAMANPPVKQRLEQKAAEAREQQLTLQMIQQKLDRANERKAMALASQVEQSREFSDRVGLIQQRKSSKERAEGQALRQELGKKLDTASARHHEKLTSIQLKARTFNDRVLLIKERRDSNERAQEDRMQQGLVSKQTQAEERQAQQLQAVKERAKCHNLMALARAQARQEEEQREIDTKKEAMQHKLSRAEQNRTDPSEKAREYNQKVIEKVSSKATEEREAADEAKARIAAKLQEAASRREGIIGSIRQTAVQSAAPRSTSASAQSPAKQ